MTVHLKNLAVTSTTDTLSACCANGREGDVVQALRRVSSAAATLADVNCVPCQTAYIDVEHTHINMMRVAIEACMSGRAEPVGAEVDPGVGAICTQTDGTELD